VAFPACPADFANSNASYDIVKLDEYFRNIPVLRFMTSVLLESLEVLLSAKRQRLAITHSPRSREVLRRQIKALREQIGAIAKKVAH
jgi:hypothetical protein